jgi:hypothetical protein
LTSPSVPKMIVGPLLISASRLPKAKPLKACDRNCARVGITRPTRAPSPAPGQALIAGM